MPKRIVEQRVVLHRDGKHVRPEIGKLFDFTQEELDEINNVNPRAVRRPIVEDDTATLDPVIPTKETAATGGGAGGAGGSGPDLTKPAPAGAPAAATANEKDEL